MKNRLRLWDAASTGLTVHRARVTMIWEYYQPEVSAAHDPSSQISIAELRFVFRG